MLSSEVYGRLSLRRFVLTTHFSPTQSRSSLTIKTHEIQKKKAKK